MGVAVAKIGLGKIAHGRTPTSTADQPVIRMNMDTLYSKGIFDLAAGPITISLPDAGGRYMAVQPVSEDHYTTEVFHDGTHTISQDDIGTRYVALLIRVFVDPNDPADLDKAHTLQDAIKVEQASVGSWEVTDWDEASLDRTRQILLDLSAMGTAGYGPRMGPRGQVDEVGHLLATAAGWGLNPESEAKYILAFPEKNDGTTIHRMVVGDVPVDGFWSVTVYDAKGFMPRIDVGRNAVNNVTAVHSADGTVAIQFGGCTVDTPNCLPITPGWNYTLRLYRPRAEISDGLWVAPVPMPVD
jgi:hypothetical protein